MQSVPKVLLSPYFTSYSLCVGSEININKQTNKHETNQGTFFYAPITHLFFSDSVVLHPTQAPCITPTNKGRDLIFVLGLRRVRHDGFSVVQVDVGLALGLQN